MTFSNAQNASLAGLLDPTGLGVGFMVPIFSAPLENARLVQRIGNDGRIERFELAEDQDSALLTVADQAVSLGDEALWGFRLGEEAIVCCETLLRARLSELIREDALRSRPMLGFEVATFLGNSDLENQYAGAAIARLNSLTPDGAKDWRDLSVLTPLLRRSLNLKLGNRGTAWLDEIYVSLDRGLALIHGMSGATSKDLSLLKAALDDATERLPNLFDRPKRGWNLRLASEDDEDERRPAPDLWITVVGVKLTHLLERSVAGRALSIGVGSLDLKAPKSSPSIAIVFEARDRTAEEEARRAAVAMGKVMIAVGTSRRGLADDGPTMLSEFPFGRIDLPNVGAYQAGALQSTDAVAVRLATAIAAELAEGIYEVPHPRSVLIRVGGRSNVPYSLASLYGRAWSLGLTPWNALHVTDLRTEHADATWGEEVRRCLFADVKIVGGELVHKALVGSRASGGLLVSSLASDEGDASRHAFNAAALMRGRRWQIDEEQFNIPQFRALGGRCAFSIHLPNPRSGETTGRGGKLPPTVPYVVFEQCERLRLVPTSSSRTILDCLQVGDFPVEMRDLVELDGGSATIWSVVAQQLRRLSSPLPSPQKTLVLGAIARAALEMSGPEGVGKGGLVHNVLDDDRIGGALHLILTRLQFNDDMLIGTISVVERGQGPMRLPSAPLESYNLSINADGPRLTFDKTPVKFSRRSVR